MALTPRRSCSPEASPVSATRARARVEALSSTGGGAQSDDRPRGERHHAKPGDIDAAKDEADEDQDPTEPRSQIRHRDEGGTKTEREITGPMLHGVTDLVGGDGQRSARWALGAAGREAQA